jgi:hypothetical protein
MPVRIVRLVHTLSYRVGNQCNEFQSEKFW